MSGEQIKLPRDGDYQFCLLKSDALPYGVEISKPLPWDEFHQVFVCACQTEEAAKRIIKVLKQNDALVASQKT